MSYFEANIRILWCKASIIKLVLFFVDVKKMDLIWEYRKRILNYGDPLTGSCFFYEKPEMNSLESEWLFQKKSLEYSRYNCVPSNELAYNNEGYKKLNIPSAKLHHSGEYTCVTRAKGTPKYYYDTVTFLLIG